MSPLPGMPPLPGPRPGARPGCQPGCQQEAGVESGQGQYWRLARPGGAVQVTVIATLDQLAAAFTTAAPATDPATDPATGPVTGPVTGSGTGLVSGAGGRGAGLARLSLAGTVGAFPGATLAPGVLARLACDSPLYRILTDPHGAVLHHGRAHRFATPAQRRALTARDGGCIIPGCGTPPEWTDAHHLHPWSHGGTTDIDAMVLLCSRHHTDHHAGLYPIRMHHGIPWVRLPAWQDPTRPWLRNTTHTHPQLAAHTAATLTGGDTPHTLTGPSAPYRSSARPAVSASKAVRTYSSPCRPRWMLRTSHRP